MKMNKTMRYVYDHLLYPAQIRFDVEADYDSTDYDKWDDLAQNMLVTLFNDDAWRWHLNTCEEIIND